MKLPELKTVDKFKNHISLITMLFESSLFL